ncbi:palmitoyltransferase ZDHHC15 [Pelobates cultripes]|uniref:Palmitoyltransferase ZDHHC15 n=1 Tax=Pelobates cultripes TaxID=61616 RepID=A0AAD1SZ66_PELCU|nr:palmitoyltransferase ZDHHC15 [Pelobates cultripes]
MALSRGLRCCQRVLSWVPVLIIALVVLWSYYAYVWELCLVTVTYPLEKVIYLIIFHAVFLIFIWTYWKAVFTPPKQPSKKFLLSYAEKERYDNEESPDAQKQILAEFARKLPVYTRTGSGGQYIPFHLWVLEEMFPFPDPTTVFTVPRNLHRLVLSKRNITTVRSPDAVSHLQV